MSAMSAPLPHDSAPAAPLPTSEVRAFLRELAAWLADRQYRLEESRDELDAAYRRGWNQAIEHVAEHAREHEQAEAGAEQAQARLKHGAETVGTVQP